MFNSHPKLVETERSNLIDELDCLDQCLNESRACPKEHKKQATNQGGLGQDTLSATVRHEWPDFVSLCGVAQTPHSNHFKIPSPFSSLDPIDIGHTYQRQIMDPESKVGNSEENLKFAKAELVSLKEDKTRMMKKYEIDMIIKRLEVIRNRLMTSGCSIDGSRATLTEKSKALEVELIDMKQLNAGHICQCRYGENSSTAPKPERMTVAFKLDNDGNIATDVHEFEDTSLEMSGEPTEESRENFPEVSKKVWSEESKYTKDSMNADHIHDLITGFVDNSDDRSAYPKNSNSNDRLSDNRASNNTDSEPGDFKSPYVAELERRLKDAEQKNAILKQLNTNINISSQKQSLKIAMLNKEIYTLEEYKSRNLNNLILTSCDAYHIRESSNPMKLCLKHAIQHITFLGKEKVMYKERCEERLKTIKQLRKVNTESRFWFDSELSYLKDQVKAIMLEKENAIKTCEEQKLMIEFLKEQPWRTGLKPRHQTMILIDRYDGLGSYDRFEIYQDARRYKYHKYLPLQEGLSNEDDDYQIGHEFSTIMEEDEEG
ncbi:MAG: hypothetical protein M1834_007579 [Cirrosporium novae-zelandiae]|nr:MAG: hypothetical protein M1834_007579 [Cirrosporium novae-zelandiae]